MTDEVYSKLPCRYINYYFIMIIRVLYTGVARNFDWRDENGKFL